MIDAKQAEQSEEIIEIDLRNPWKALFWAWLIPGAGHFYQRRYGKSLLFATCILGVYFFGLSLADGHVVYASWTKTDRRWQYICQLGVGLPALPAIVQNWRVMDQPRRRPWFADEENSAPMAPPWEQPVEPNRDDMLAGWHRKYHTFFELGTLYTVVAGLLNVLAIYDAFAGPVIVGPAEEPAPDPKKKKAGGDDED